MKARFHLAIIAFLPVAAAVSAPKPLAVPSIQHVFQDNIVNEIQDEQMSHRAWNDGKSAIFERANWKISYNNREITLVHTPQDADVRQFAEFLYKEPFQNALARRLREGAELTMGEREMIRLVYTSWIDSLKALTSLGYQQLAFHANVNGRLFSQGKKNVTYGDGTMFSGLYQNYFDRKAGPSEPVSALAGWGVSFDETKKQRRDLLKAVIHGGDRKQMGAMNQQQLNEYFYVSPHVVKYKGETTVSGIASSRSELWRRLHEELKVSIAILAEIKEDLAEWKKSFKATTLSSSQAATLDEEIERMRGELDAANEEAVRRARILFYDYPFARACLIFKKDIKDSLGLLYSRNTEISNLTRAARNFHGEIAGDIMLKNIKSRYAANEYGNAKDLFDKSAGNQSYRILTSVGVRILDADTLRSLSEGRDLWTENVLVDAIQDISDFSLKIQKDAEKAVDEAKAARDLSAAAIEKASQARDEANAADARAEEAKNDATDTLESHLDIPQAKEIAGKAKSLSIEAANLVFKSRDNISGVESKNAEVKSQADITEAKRRDAIGNATQAPDIARLAANDALKAAASAKSLAEEGKGLSEEAVKNSAEATKMAEEALKTAATATEMRKKEEARVAEEKEDEANKALLSAGESEGISKQARETAGAAREKAELMLKECIPTNKSHLEIPETKALAVEAGGIADEAIAVAKSSNIASDDTDKMVANVRDCANTVIEKAAIAKNANQKPADVRAALDEAIAKAEEATRVAKEAVEASAKARDDAKSATEKAADSEIKTTKATADRKAEEKRVATEKKASAEKSAKTADAASDVAKAARETAGAARGKAEQMLKECVPTNKTHLDIPETKALAVEAGKMADEAIRLSKSSDSASGDAEKYIEKARASIAITIAKADVALDPAQDPDTVRDALDKAIVAASDAKTFSEAAQTSAEKAQDDAKSAAENAADSEAKTTKATADRKAEEKRVATEKKASSEALLKAVDECENTTAKTREESAAAREKALQAKATCVPTAKSHLAIPEIKETASKADKLADEAIKLCKSSESNADDAAKKIKRTRENAQPAIDNASTALNPVQTPDSVREALDKAIDYDREAMTQKTAAESFTLQSKNDAAVATEKSAEAEKLAEEAAARRKEKERETAIAKDGEAKAAIAEAKAVSAAAKAAVQRAEGASQAAAALQPQYDQTLKSKADIADAKKTAKSARKAADDAISNAKDAMSAAKRAESRVAEVCKYAEEAIAKLNTAQELDQNPDVVRESLDEAIDAVDDMASPLKDAKSYLEKAKKYSEDAAASAENAKQLTAESTRLRAAAEAQ